MKIYQVTAVVVFKNGDHLAIHAMGLTSSSGWTNPRLTNDDPSPADPVLEYSFEADRPGGVTLPVLTPTIASTVAQAKDVEAVIVKARTNSMTVHASEFQSFPRPTPAPSRPNATEAISAAETLTTLMLGEEQVAHHTLRFGEGPPFTTMGIIAGEEDPPRLTTMRLGEELGPIGPLGTDVRLDDPAAIFNGLNGAGAATPIDPSAFGQGNPFAGF